MNLVTRALDVYKLTGDPLDLDAIRVLSDPANPHYETAAQMVALMEEALHPEPPPTTDA